MRQIQKWTETDKQKLVDLVDQNTANSRTNWIQVAQQINRMPNQCKSYYAVAIKQCVPKKCNLVLEMGPQSHFPRRVFPTSHHDVGFRRGILKFAIMKVVSSHFLHFQLIPKCGVGVIIPTCGVDNN
ncbi:Myb-like_DNA-binding domain-containing protein [Hexamita inflata]|uniref:Myb-like DNA-binding domain-containing protein n=1 Tax=Hexamita inflata TaxID=28002 RepID=A0AA86TTB1_9EUKA|nr:Myb-like DNA-binding domain-containing protein [Hexamita inflata]